MKKSDHLQTSRGSIAKLALPEGWEEAVPESDGYIEFAPTDSAGLSFSYYNREFTNYKPSKEHLLRFSDMLEEPGELSAEQLYSINTVLGQARLEHLYQSESSEITEVSGRNLLRVRGRWIKDDVESLLFFWPSDPESMNIEQVMYEGPKDPYQKHLPAIVQAFSKIEWKDYKAPPFNEEHLGALV